MMIAIGMALGHEGVEGGAVNGPGPKMTSTAEIRFESRRSASPPQWGFVQVTYMHDRYMYELGG